MSLSVLWTDEAQETFDRIVILIEDKWGMISAQKFIQVVQKTIMLIKVQPYLYKSSATLNCRHAVITPQTSMFYEVTGNQIIILFFYDNRQDPMID